MAGIILQSINILMLKYIDFLFFKAEKTEFNHDKSRDFLTLNK